MSPTGLFRAWWEPVAVALVIVAVILAVGTILMQPTFDSLYSQRLPALTLSPNWSAS